MTKTVGEASELIGGIGVPLNEIVILAVMAVKDHPGFMPSSCWFCGDSATGEGCVKHVYSRLYHCPMRSDNTCVV